MSAPRARLYARFFNRRKSKEMPRGNRKCFDDNFATRKGALSHARRRLERAYGMKGECSFNEEELDELRQIFEFYDIDSSKTMDLSELNMALRALGYNASEKDVHDLAALMDVDGDMTMDFSEFCMIVEFMREEKGLEEELRDAFRSIDTSGCGYVTAEELLDLLMTQGNTMSLKEASELIRFVDKNGDGKLDYEEFMRIILEGKNLSRSTTFYSTAPSSINSLRTECISKSGSKNNIGKEISGDDLSVSFKTAMTSQTNGTIAELVENVPMTILSPKESPGRLQGDKTSPTSKERELTSKTSANKADNDTEVAPLTEGPSSSSSEQGVDGTLKDDQEPVAIIPETGKITVRVARKIKSVSLRDMASTSIKVVGPKNGEILGSVVLENPRPLDE